MKPTQSRPTLRAAGVVVALTIAAGGLVHGALVGMRLAGIPQGWSPFDLGAALTLEVLLACAVTLPLALPAFWRKWAAVPLPAAGLLAAHTLGWVAPSTISSHPLVDASPAGPSTVVLITTDTLRRDHVSVYPDAVAGDLTPNLDAIASESALFLDAVSTAPLTLPSHTAMLSGRDPAEMGVFMNGMLLPADLDAAPAALARAGYRTGAFTSASVLHGSHGLSRWFHVYRDHLGARPGARWMPLQEHLRRLKGWWDEHRDPSLVMETGDRTTDRALRWLDTLPEGAPAFLWVHLYDAHAPHAPHPELSGESTSLPHPCTWSAHPAAARRRTPHPLLPDPPPLPPASDCDPRKIDKIMERTETYARAVRYLDQQVGALVEGLRERGRWEGAAAVVVADHGESLVEHQQFVSHQWSLHDPVVRVPLLVRGPGVEVDTIERAVSTRRVGATLLHLAGLSDDAAPGPHLLIDTEDTPAAIGPAPIAQRLVPPGLKPIPLQATVRYRGRKVLLDEIGHTERYDLATDPLEAHALVTQAEHDANQARIAKAQEGPGGPSLPMFPWERGRRRDGRHPGARKGRLEQQKKHALAQPGVAGEVADVAPFATHDAEVARTLRRARQAADARKDTTEELPDDVQQALEVLGYVQ